MPDAATRFESARAVLAAALRDRKWPLERIEDLCRGDPLGGACKLIPAMAAAGGGHETAALQLFQQLADRRQADAGAFGHLGSGPQPVGLACEAREDHGPVVGQFADAKHGRPRPRSIWDHSSPIASARKGFLRRGGGGADGLRVRRRNISDFPVVASFALCVSTAAAWMC